MINKSVAWVPLLTLFFNIFDAHLSLARDRRWCYFHDFRPCNGQPGRCTRNSDLSLGGFVADSATVEKNIFGLNRPKLDQFTQVCDQAKVLGHAHLWGFSSVWNQAEVSERAFVSHGKIAGNAVVTGHSSLWSTLVWGNTRVDGHAEVHHSQIWDNARVSEYSYVTDSEIDGTAVLLSNTQVINCSFSDGVKNGITLERTSRRRYLNKPLPGGMTREPFPHWEDFLHKQLKEEGIRSGRYGVGKWD